MPSSATITTFYNFTEGTRTRASQVNNNFEVFRGHFIPVHVSTATSSNNTYDLGSADYYWRNAYIQNLYASSISNLSISNSFQSTPFSLSLGYTTGSTTFANINISIDYTKNIEIGFVYNNTTSADAYIYNSDTTTTLPFVRFSLYRDTTTSLVASLDSISDKAVSSTNDAKYSLQLNNFTFIDSTIASGSYNYFIKYYFLTGTSTQLLQFTNIRMYARTL